jgi:hypothetical protein
MTDKNGPPTSTDWWRECQSLRAEVERLRAALEEIYIASRRNEVSWRLGALAREALGSTK